MALTARGDGFVNDDTGITLTPVVAVDKDGVPGRQFSVATTNPTLGTSYVVAELTSFAMFGATAPTANKAAYMYTLTVHVDSIASSPTTITPKITEDTAGDFTAWVGGAANIQLGQATATRGSASWQISESGFLNLVSQATFPVWLKLDTGSARVNSIMLTWNTL